MPEIHQDHMNEREGIELGLYLENVPYIECTTMRKFGLNKSGYLISFVKDQYFYWKNLKKTDKSPHTLHFTSFLSTPYSKQHI